MTRTTPPNSEAGLAQAFAAKHAGHARYVHATSPRRWFIRVDAVWERDKQWEPDTRLIVQYWIMEICCAAAAELHRDDPALARQLCSANFISAVERLARCDPRLAASRGDVGLPPPKKRGAK